MALRLPSISIVLVATAALMACSDETEEAASVEADAGADVEHEMPSVESVDFDEAAPSEPQEIRVQSSRQRGVISNEAPLPADDFLTEEHAERLITDTDLEALPIAGQDVTETQNSIRYAPVGAELDLFGAGLQIWDLDDADLTPGQRLAELRDQFLNVDDDLDDAPRDAFLSQRSGIRSVGFVAEDGPYVFVLSCDVDHCDRDDLVEMAQTIASEH